MKEESLATQKIKSSTTAFRFSFCKNSALLEQALLRRV